LSDEKKEREIATSPLNVQFFNKTKYSIAYNYAEQPLKITEWISLWRSDWFIWWIV